MLLRGLNGIMYKEVLQVMRDPATIVMTIMMPLLQLTLYGYAIDTEVRNVATVVIDQDKTKASRDFVDRLTATGLYNIVGSTDSTEEMYQSILRDEAKVGIRLPVGYERDLNNGRGATVQVLIDGSNNTIASQTLGTVQNVGFAINSELLLLRNPGATGPPLEVRPRLLFNPSLRSANFFVPGLMGILLSMVTTQLTALGIVREREVGTLEQLMVTPISKGALMLGKILPYVALGMVQMMVVLFFAQALFRVPIHGNIFLLLALALVFVFSSLGQGLIISTIARTQQQAMMMSFLFIMPSIMLSGYIFPRESMPVPIQAFSAILPVTYFIEILRNIVIRGAGWEAVWKQTLILAVMGVATLALATFRFRKSLA
jgi:ABC-2 type transport system permease protein